MLLLLRRISREQHKTIFLSTHDLELALQTADVVWLMERGGRINIGTPAQLASEGALTRFIERSDGIHFDADRLSVQVRFSD
jgi:iron complex transport system ATP-binding protein